jgi:hypothetical protein
LRKKNEKIAVVIMTPPLEICQTLLATMFKAIYDNKDANKSITAGKRRSHTGAGYFL